MVDRLEAAAAARVNVNIDELLRTSLALAHVDPVDLFKADGSMRPIHQIPKHARLAIASLEITEEYAGTGKKRRVVSRQMKPRLLDKNTALERLFKYKGMFSKDNEQKADVIRQFMEAVSGKSRGLPGDDK
jgi:phage terminase small subunit